MAQINTNKQDTCALVVSQPSAEGKSSSLLVPYIRIIGLSGCIGADEVIIKRLF